MLLGFSVYLHCISSCLILSFNVSFSSVRRQMIACARLSRRVRFVRFSMEIGGSARTLVCVIGGRLCSEVSEVRGSRWSLLQRHGRPTCAYRMRGCVAVCVCPTYA